MPNGRSGGFLLGRPEFEHLLSQHDDLTEFGRFVQGPAATVSDVKRLLRKKKWGKVIFEEQDGSWYVVHLKEWVVVRENSPFYQILRSAHRDFLAEWNRKHRK